MLARLQLEDVDSMQSTISTAMSPTTPTRVVRIQEWLQRATRPVVLGPDTLVEYVPRHRAEPNGS